MVQIIVLAAVAFFLFWRLRSVLGSRQGFEKNNIVTDDITSKKRENKSDSNIIELKANEVDEEIADYVEPESPAFKALSKMKNVEKDWLVSSFVSGAKLAYEQILMAFEKSDLLPELQGRLPVRVELSALTEEDFVRILKETDNSLTKQYSALMNTEGIKLKFEEIASGPNFLNYFFSSFLFCNILKKPNLLGSLYTIINFKNLILI